MQIGLIYGSTVATSEGVQLLLALETVPLWFIGFFHTLFSSLLRNIQTWLFRNVYLDALISSCWAVCRGIEYLQPDKRVHSAAELSPKVLWD